MSATGPHALRRCRVLLAVAGLLYAGLAVEFWAGIFPVPREKQTAAVLAVVLTSVITVALVLTAWRKPSGRASFWLTIIAGLQGGGSLLTADWIVGVAYLVDAGCFLIVLEHAPEPQ